MKLILFLIFILSILLIPIPIKLKFRFDGKSYELFIYGKQIFINKKRGKGKPSVKDKKKKQNAFTIKNLLYSVKEMKLKPSLKFKLDLVYGLDDAAATGLIYGLIYAVYPLVYQIFRYIFNVTSYNFNINPDFNKQIFKLSAESIISVNLVKIIYMFVVIIKNYKTSQKLAFTNTSNINL